MEAHKTITHKKRLPIRLPDGRLLHFSRPLVMSIVNCTPDSFYTESGSAGSNKVNETNIAVERALMAESQGADIIDFGAESTRPGALFVNKNEEIRRLIPVLRLFRKQSSLPVSVDTRKAAVARLALDEGADIINDISALADPDMLPLCADRKAALVLMHTPQPDAFSGVGEFNYPEEEFFPHRELPCNVEEIWRFLLQAAKKAQMGGVNKENIILDPGFGFGKTTEDNILLFNRLETMARGDYPFLVGVSRKRFIGEICGRETEGRLAGTIAANVYAIILGADIIRVHDTEEAVDAVKLISALAKADHFSENIGETE